MTLVVATTLGDTPDELYERGRQAAAGPCDWIEVRLDGPGGLPWDLRAFFSHPKPSIATMRHVDDGGRSHADDETRAAILRRALKAGARAIDVELVHADAAALVQEAHAAGARAILSHHDLVGTPSPDALLETLREMRVLGADWCKLATRVESPSDAASLVEAARKAREEGIPYALMAVNDPFLRLLAPTLGMALAYGSLEGVPAAAPGQVDVSRLKAAHVGLAPRAARTRGTTRLALLLGHPVSHSKSPAMHNAAFAELGLDATYAALDVPPEKLGDALRGLRATNALGANLTVPHKVAAMALVDELDASAREAGAINTLVLRDGRLVGHNTDGAGALDALAEAGVRVASAQCLVLGAGGAARGLVHALRRAGAKVIVTNRTLEKAKMLAQDAGTLWLPWEEAEAALRHCDLVANATTVGLLADESPVDPAKLGARTAVLDAVYRHGGTKLVREARQHGLVAVPGEAMLLHQGARAFTLWTGKPAPVEAMRAALEAEA